MAEQLKERVEKLAVTLASAQRDNLALRRENKRLRGTEAAALVVLGQIEGLFARLRGDGGSDDKGGGKGGAPGGGPVEPQGDAPAGSNGHDDGGTGGASGGFEAQDLADNQQRRTDAGRLQTLDGGPGGDGRVVGKSDWPGFGT